MSKVTSISKSTEEGHKGLDYISYRGPADAVSPIDNPWNAYSDFMSLGGTPAMRQPCASA